VRICKCNVIKAELTRVPTDFGTPLRWSLPKNPVPNTIQQFMLYRSFVQDAPTCSVGVSDGVASINGINQSSGAATCPDAFAWAQLTNAIAQSFWNWGIDETIWPKKPLPLCTAGISPSNCCNPNAEIMPGAQPNDGCPYFRADYETVSPLPTNTNQPNGSIINHRGTDPGRVLRDLELELVFRNQPMIDYIYRNDLYSKEGLGSRNIAQNNAIGSGDIAAVQKFQVKFPIDSVMFKADFISMQVMLDRQLIVQGPDLNIPPNNQNYPYITVYLPGTGEKDQNPGYYYLVAMTNSSKALPVWHWYAMEHVANKGRCDYIGCNDSFGYSVNPSTYAGGNFGTHFIAPNTFLNNDKLTGNDTLFSSGKVYLPANTGEVETLGLAELFQDMGIATDAVDSNHEMISATDPAWKSYRLKGTQSTFTTTAGVPTGMGATVTEGGFVNSASCTTCHSQASVDRSGNTNTAVGGSWRLNLQGYNQVEMGSPNPSWFYTNDIPTIIATQIDFVWGILNAKCQQPVDNKGVNCVLYPDEPIYVPEND
jgi:hypothetical protein